MQGKGLKAVNYSNTQLPLLFEMSCPASRDRALRLNTIQRCLLNCIYLAEVYV